MKALCKIVIYLACLFYSYGTLADSGNVGALLDEYSKLIDIAVSDESVYDHQLKDSRTKILKAVNNDSDRDRVVDMVGRLLDWAHKYNDVTPLDGSAAFAITYGTDFLISLGTEKAHYRLLDEYAFWDNRAVTGALKSKISKIADQDDLVKIRFANIQYDKDKKSAE